MLRLDPDEKLKLEDRATILFNSTLRLSKTVIEIPAKSYVDKNFNDPSITKTLLMLTSVIKISITLDSLE